MDLSVIAGLLVPFIGTTIGAGLVFFLKNNLSHIVQCALAGFAAGVMTAASVWSLLIPAIERSEYLGSFAFLPAVVGFWAGSLILLAIDKAIPDMQTLAENAENNRFIRSKTTMLILAVTIHNIPEGMAVGVMYAGLISGAAGISAGGAFALALGIAIQNIPEGAIISMPLLANGRGKNYAFLGGVLSGAVEPIAALITVLISALMVPVMPYLLSFAAGAMIYVVVKELVPEISEFKHSDIGIIMFSAGFTVMMLLDVALG